eukprot:6334199-Amphidinium_carterae.1
MGEQEYHTFAAGASNEGGYESPPIAEAVRMTFKEFIRRQKEATDGKAYYLQTPLLQYDSEKDEIKCAKFDEEIAPIPKHLTGGWELHFSRVSYGSEGAGG